jgi:hypothetical protein
MLMQKQVMLLIYSCHRMFLKQYAYDYTRNNNNVYQLKIILFYLAQSIVYQNKFRENTSNYYR